MRVSILATIAMVTLASCHGIATEPEETVMCFDQRTGFKYETPISLCDTVAQ
jgi:hypothetical protein